MDTDDSKDAPDVTVDESTRYKGVVKEYNRRRGFGYILPDGQEDDRKNRMFVHWKQIQSDDSWPALEEGQKVEYYEGTKTKGKQEGKKSACKVTAHGGGNIVTGSGRTYLDKSQRFTGVVKYWNAEKGFGYIKIESDISIGGTDFTSKNDVYVPIDEIVTDDEPPALKLKDEVQFTLYKTEKGSGAASVTAKDGSNYSWPREDRPKDFGKKKTGFGPAMKMFGMMGAMGGGMGIQFINGQPYALVPKGMGMGGGGGRWGNRWGGGGGGGGWKKKEQGAADADGAQPGPGELSAEQEIRAKWKDGKWYSGKVSALNSDGTVKVFWTKFKNFSDTVQLGDIRVGGSVPAAAMKTDSGDSGTAVHSW